MWCILCLKSCEGHENFINIFSSEGRLLNIKGIIENHFSIKTNAKTVTGRNICRQCWDIVYCFHELYERVEEVHKNFEEINFSGKVVTDEIKVECEPIKIESEALEKTTNKRGRGRPRRQKFCSESLNKTVTKIAADDLHDSQSIATNQTSLETNDVSGEDLKKELPVEKFELINADISVTAIDELAEDDIKVVQFDDPMNVDDTLSRNDISNSDTEIKGDTKSINKKFLHSHKTIVTKQYDEFISSNFKLVCCLCNVPLENFTELKTHFRGSHKIRGYVLCCGKKLLKRGVLVDHIRTHQNPEYFKCEQCGKVMADRRCLELHVRGHEDKRERIYNCDVCSKSFYRLSVFNRHKLTHVTDDQKNIACPQCGKTFANKYLMNQHLRIVHMNLYAKICDICGKSIRGREALKRHQEEHAGIAQSPIQCDLCGVALTTKYGLTRHIKMMHTEENLVPKVCTICFKESPSLSAHHRHIKYTHKMLRKHGCPMCDKAFKRATELKEHMTTHTGDVLYTCPHCPKTFNSNANMHSHRKKVHRKEWEERRLQKYSKPLKLNSNSSTLLKNATNIGS